MILEPKSGKFACLRYVLGFATIIYCLLLILQNDDLSIYRMLRPGLFFCKDIELFKNALRSVDMLLNLIVSFLDESRQRRTSAFCMLRS
jgi:hypothetical protein